MWQDDNKMVNIQVTAVIASIVFFLNGICASVLIRKTRQPRQTWPIASESGNIYDEAEVILEQKRLQQEEVFKILGHHFGTCERTEFKNEAITEKVWKLSQSRDTRKEFGTGLGQYLEFGEGAWLDKRHPGHGQLSEGKRGRSV